MLTSRSRLAAMRRIRPSLPALGCSALAQTIITMRPLTAAPHITASSMLPLYYSPLVAQRRLYSSTTTLRATPSPSSSSIHDDDRHRLPSERALSSVCREEMRLEELRDAVEGVQAIAPMVPPGWHMDHRGANANYFVLTRNTSSAQKHHHRRRGSERAQGEEGDEDEGALLTSHRVFRSKHDDAIAAMHQQQRRAGSSGSTTSAAREEGDPFLPVTPQVQIYCPMRTIDPSLHDASVDLCEWTPFDVLVKKPLDRSGGTVIMFSMASVNSELRLRGVQLLSPKQSHTALNPRFLRHNDNDQGAQRGRGDGGDGHRITAFAPPPSSSAEALDTVTAFDLAGEYYRTTQLYRGPLLSELSKPLQEELLTYVHNVLGISNEVREFIAQMLFVLEQEAYIAWLAQVDHFCQRGPPSSSTSSS